jgi:hypothetical protein
VAAAVVRREHLDVLGVAPAVRPEEVDLEIGKLHASVGVRETVILSPSAHLIAVAPGPAVAVCPATVGFLEEHLILAPKVLFEDYALNVRALFDQALRGPQIRSIELRVVNQFTLTGWPVMERLPWVVICGSVRLQKFSSALCERHEICAGLLVHGRDMANQPLRAEVFNVAVPQVGSPVVAVPEIVDRDDAKGPDGCERAHFGATQVVLFVGDRHWFAIEPPWQVEALSEDLARIDKVEGVWIPLQATGSASGLPVSGVVPT